MLLKLPLSMFIDIGDVQPKTVPAANALNVAEKSFVSLVISGHGLKIKIHTYNLKC